MGKFGENLIRLMAKKVGKADQKRLKKISLIEGVREYTDIPYIDDGDEFHTLDVYRPDNSEVLPVIIDFHGGAWVYGTKQINKPFCYSMAGRGFVVVNVNYRLAPSVNLAEMVADCVAAVDYVIGQAGNYGGDVSNLFLAGDSAGGQLACLTAAISVCDEWRDFYGAKGFAVPIKGVWSMCGVVTGEMLSSPKFLIRTLVGMLYGKNAAQVSGRAFICQLPDNISFPPLLLSDCERDFAYSDQLRLKKEMDRRGLVCQTCLWDKSHKINHVYNVAYPYADQSEKTNDVAAMFFKEIANGHIDSGE